MKAFIVKLCREYASLKIRICASSATFYIIVSIIPLVGILFFALSLLSTDLSYELESFLVSLLPSGLAKEFHTVIEIIKESPLSALVPFSILTALWGSTKGINGVCFGIEAIYHSYSKDGFFKRILKSLWRAFLFYCLIIASVLLIFLSKRITKNSEYPLLLLNAIVRLRIVIFVLALTLFFATVYSRLSHKRFASQLQGALFSSLGWTAFTYFYSIYVSYSLNNASIYAGMSAVILFMLWCYFCVNIILIGALINKVRD